MLIGGAILAGLALSGAINPDHAFAGYAICTTDPIVHLSNGKSVTISAAITDVASDIKKVTYTLHIPAGVGVTGIVYTGGVFTGKEAMTVYADNAASTYTSTTMVKTGGKTAVPVTTTIAAKGSINGISASVSGLSGQILSAQIVAP